MYFALLDILRFLSSLAVVFHHTFLFHYGKLGVYLFFIISGFVIHFSLSKGLKEYAIGRFLRLYPLFWFCCTLTYFVTVLYGNNLPLAKYFISMLMFNDGKIAQMVDGSYWTLTFELLFYFYIAVFVSLFSVKKLHYFYAGWLAVSFICFYLQIDQNIIAKLLSIRFAPYFVFGGMLALIISTYRTSSVQVRAAYIAILVAAATLPQYISDSLRAQQGVISNFTGSFEPDEMLVVQSFFILIPLAVYFSYFSFAKNKTFITWSLLLGGITYPLYLLHWKIGETLITSYGYIYGEINVLSATVVIGLLVISYIFSVYDLRLRKILKNILFKKH